MRKLFYFILIVSASFTQAQNDCFTFTSNSTNTSACGVADGSASVTVTPTTGGQTLTRDCIDQSNLPSPVVCDNCTKTLSQGSSDITVNTGEKMCVPAGYTGNVIVNGGTLVVCAGAVFYDMTFNSGTVYINAGVQVLQLTNGDGAGTKTIHNYGGITIEAGNYTGSLYNYAAFAHNNNVFTVQTGGTLYSQADFEVINLINEGTINNYGSDINNNALGITQNFTNNSTVNNYCDIVVGGTYIENGTRNDWDPNNVSTGGSGCTPVVNWTDGSGNTIATDVTSISNLDAGNYTATITCGTCSENVTVAVNSGPVNFSVSGSATDATDNTTCDGVIDLTISGTSTAPYTYQLNGQTYTTEPVTGLCAGTYTIAVTDANGCTATGTDVTIGVENCTNNYTITKENPGCAGNNGTITVNLGNGNGNVNQLLDKDCLDADNLSNAVSCDNCTRTLNLNDANTTVNPNETVCITNGYNGNLTINGGTVNVCGGNLKNVYFNSGTLNIGKGAVGIAHLYNGSGNKKLTNYGTLVVTAGSYSGALFNYAGLHMSGNHGMGGDLTIPAGDTLYSQADLNIVGTLTINGIVNNRAGRNQNALDIEGNLINNGVLNNYCNVEVGGNYSGNGIVNDWQTDPDYLPGGGNTGNSTCSVVWKDVSGNVIGTEATITGLGAGDYTLELTCDGCTTTETITLEEETSTITFTASVVDDEGNCTGGLGLSSLNGGTAPYTYALTGVTDPSFSQTGPLPYTNLCAGTYLLTVTDDKGCFASQEVTIGGQNTCGLTIIRNYTNITCSGSNDGTIDLEVSGSSSGGSCSVGQFQAPVSCSQCDQVLSGNIGTVYIGNGQTYCIQAGSNVSGQVNVANGNLVICGDISNVSVSLQGGSVYNLANNSPLLSKITSAWGNSKVYNYGSMVVGSNVSININKFFNYGEINGGSYTVRGGNKLYNYCTFNVTDLTIVGQLTNESTVTIDNLFKINGGAHYYSTSGSYLKTNTLHLIGTLNGADDDYASVEITDNNIANWGSAIRKKLKICGLTNDLNKITVESSVQLVTDCDELSGSCTITWTLNGTSFGTGNSFTNLSAGTYTYSIDCGSGCLATGTIQIEAPQALTASTEVVSEPSCSDKCDGELKAIVSGGTGQYTYEWDGNPALNESFLFPACEGTHTLVVKDQNGCGEALAVGILTSSNNDCCTGTGVAIVPPVATTNTSATDVFDGTATVTTQGGTTPYLYRWSSGTTETTENTTSTVTELGVGSYTIEVIDDAFCKDELSFSINSDNTVSLCTNYEGTIAVINRPLCPQQANGELKVTVSNGTAPYTYRWFDGNRLIATVENESSNENSQTGLPYGEYRVEVIDGNGCKVEIAQVLNYTTEVCPCDIQLNLFRVSPASCKNEADGAIFLSLADFTAPYIISWNGPESGTITSGSGPSSFITNLLPGEYEVTILDASQCFDRLIVIIDGYNQPCECTSFALTSSVNNTTDDVTCDGSLTVTVDEPAGVDPNLYTYEFQWSNGSYFTGAKTSTISGQCHGDYSVIVRQLVGKEVICQQEIDLSLDFDTEVGGECTAATNDLALTITTVQTPPCVENCYGSFINLSVTGGSGNYTYLWNNGVTSQDLSHQCAGEYTVTVQSGECEASRTVTLEGPEACTTDCTAPFDVDFLVTDASTPCSADGSIDLIIGCLGDGGKYRFDWQRVDAVTEDIHNQPPGTYFVTVYDRSGNPFVLGPLTIRSKTPVCEETPCAGTAIVTDPLQCPKDMSGALDLVLQGGIAPLTYKWRVVGTTTVLATTQDYANVGPGTYEVEVTDDDECSFVSNPVTLEAPEEGECDCALVRWESTPTGCPNEAPTGTIAVSVIGGVNPVINWNPTNLSGSSISGLAAGNYQLVVIDPDAGQRCYFEEVIPIEAEYDPNTCGDDCSASPSITVDYADGCDLVATLTVNPALGIYDWSTGERTREITVTTPGIYTVDVSNNICTWNELSVNVQDVSIELDGEITADADFLCDGGTVNLTAPTLNGATYTWYPGAVQGQTLTVSTAGSYWVEISTGSCVITTDPFTVLPAFTSTNLMITTEISSICPESDVVYPLGSPVAEGIIWLKDGVVIPNSENQQIIYVSEPGVYTLQVTQGNCAIASADLTISERTDCNNTSIFCDPLSIITRTVSEDELISCADQLREQAEYTAQTNYNEYVNGLIAGFRQRYIDHCLKVSENFTISSENGEAKHHTTLYYYDQAGNLVRTIPPEGVNPLETEAELTQVALDRALEERNIFTKHTYPTTYTYNSLNQLIAQAVPDNDRIQKFDITRNQFATGIRWNGANLNASGNGVVFGVKDGLGVIYTTNDGGETWDELQGVGIGNLTAVSAFKSGNNTLAYAVGENGVFLKYNESNGTNWTIGSTGLNIDFDYIRFFDATNGVIANNMGLTYRTTDGGDNWNENNNLLNAVLGGTIEGTISDIEFVTTTNWYVSTKDGENGHLYVTDDAGATITELFAQTDRQTYALANDGEELYTFGQDGLITRRTANETTSQLTASGTSLNINDAEAYNGGFILNQGGDFYQYDPTTGAQEVLPGVDDVTVNKATGTAIALDGTNYTEIGGTVAGTLSATPTHIAFDEEHYVYTTNNTIRASEESGADGSYTNTLVNGPKAIYLDYQPGIGYYNVVVLQNKEVLFKIDLKDDVLDADAGNTAFPWTEASLFDISGNTYTLGASETLLEMVFVNEDIAYLVSNENLFVSEDGGRTWTLQPNGDIFNDNTTLNSLTKFDFSLSGIYALRIDGVLYRYNSGTGWQAQVEAIQPLPINDLAFDENQTNGYAVGEDGMVITISQTPTEITVLDRVTRNTESLVAVTTDGANNEIAARIMSSEGTLLTGTGLSFTTTSTTNTDFTAREITYHSGIQNGFTRVLGTNGKTYTLESSNTTWEEELDVTGVNAITSTTGTPAIDHVAVGEGGKIYQSEDNANLTPVNALDLVTITDAEILEDGTGYAVGENGVIITTEDGGQSWLFQSSGTSNNLTGVSMNSPTHGSVVGINTYLYTNNGGNSWETPTNPPTVTLNDVSLYTTTMGYAVGAGGIIYQTNDTNLTTVASPTSANLTAITMVDGTTGYAVGDNNTIIKYQSTTNLWELSNTDLPAGINTNFKDVYFVDREIGYAVGENGVVLKTLNGGQTWRSDESNSTLNDETVVGITFEDDRNGLIITQSANPTEEDGTVNNLRDEKDKYSTLFWYDELGRLVLSQNAKQYQKTPKAYSYTFYDEIGRITEVGEVATNLSPNFLQDDLNESNQIRSDLHAFFVQLNGVRTEVTQTTYDEVSEAGQRAIDYFNARIEKPEEKLMPDRATLRNRVTTTIYMDEYNSQAIQNGMYDHATHYLYDIHGNVNTLVQENPFLKNLDRQYVRIDYDYDLVSGNVNQVIYNDKEVDQYFHRYEYDADNRITKVLTSPNGKVWQEDVDYDYYRHGPLKRTEIGDLNVQGMDYTYTIHGWLKSVNSNNLSDTTDPGRDDGTRTPKDVCGFSLGYYQGDYQAIKTTNPGLAITGSGQVTTANSLYNGNIAQKVEAVAQFMQTNSTEPTTVFTYQYDQLNRLKNANYHNSNNTGVTTASTDYNVSLTYDANGNIKRLTRNAIDPTTDNTGNNNMDDFYYAYKDIAHGFERNTNQLLGVHDAGDNSLNNDATDSWGDLRIGQDTTLENANYEYDGIGNLIVDKQEEIEEIVWTVYGKVKEVRRTSTSSKSDLAFDYDAAGNRISKLVKPRDGDGYQPKTMWTKTYYIRDASGNVMATYTQKYETENNTNKATLTLDEQMMYGSSRLGIQNRTEALSEVGVPNLNAVFEKEEVIVEDTEDYKELPPKGQSRILLSMRGSKQYELSDHLGNVATVVTDQKIPSFTGLTYEAVVTSATEYYPFGMSMPGKTYQTPSYRYGFNGMERDDEILGTGNGYTTQFRMYDARIGRWFSVDKMKSQYPSMSPYSAFNNNPIYYVDPTGLSGEGPVMSHEVQSGETLSQIAYKYQTTVASIKEANENIDWENDRRGGDLIKIGERLNVPVTAEYVSTKIVEMKQSLSNSVDEISNSDAVQSIVNLGEQLISPLTTSSETIPTSNGNGKIVLWNITWIGALEQTYGKLEARTKITDVSGFWNYEATTGNGLETGAGMGFDVEAINATKGPINFEPGVRGTDLAELMNKAPLIHHRGAGAIIRYTNFTAYDSRSTMNPIWSSHTWGGGLFLGLGGAASVEEWENVGLTPSDSLIRAIYDPTLSGRDAFLENKFGGSFKDSVTTYKKKF